jgi:hypothetical protein
MQLPEMDMDAVIAETRGVLPSIRGFLEGYSNLPDVDVDSPTASRPRFSQGEPLDFSDLVSMRVQHETEVAKKGIRTRTVHRYIASQTEAAASTGSAEFELDCPEFDTQIDSFASLQLRLDRISTDNYIERSKIRAELARQFNAIIKYQQERAIESGLERSGRFQTLPKAGNAANAQVVADNASSQVKRSHHLTW